ncbi:MAG: 16S rRNA (guanine(966)-N(2))-methyltransferase RsmD [Myxococcaceae bacterium]
MRIVGGLSRGRRLLAPVGREIRPTADRVRETLFNVLGQTFEPIRVLDLFAGTGALGFEALSRGAAFVVFVDHGKEAQQLVTDNAKALGVSEQMELLRSPVERALETLRARGGAFELVFSDPPYASRQGAGVLEALSAAALVAKNGWVVVEHDADEVLLETVGCFQREDERGFGDIRVSLYRAA